MTFYLKYRSKTVNELDLAGVRLGLNNIISSKNIPHAFLFSGPKGSGKTSAARIIARVVNCENPDKKTGEPCNKCTTCLSIIKGDNLDVIEIDAASHRGIDDIRVLRDAVKLAPATGKKKVYIIDEAHMLTTEASNALLKTLEEPPDHVIFILATTNPEKLIETIRSRTVNITFTKAREDEIVRSLARVAEGEKLKAGNDVLYLIASASDGSFRDAIKILEDLVVSNINLEKEKVAEYLFNTKTFDPEKFVGILVRGDEKSAYSEIEKVVETGIPIKNITASVLECLRMMLLAKVGIAGNDKGTLTKEEVLELIGLISKSYSEVGHAVLEQIPLELAVSEWCGKRVKPKASGVNTDGSKEDNDIGTSQSEDSAKEKLKVKIMTGDDEIINGMDLTSNGFSEVVWTKVLTEIKPKNTSTEALLRAAKPIGFDGKTLTLGVYYKFHKERLETNPHRSILESVIQEVTGTQAVRVVCTLTDPPEKVHIQEKSETRGVENSDVLLTEGEDADIIKAAKEIFGS